MPGAIKKLCWIIGIICALVGCFFGMAGGAFGCALGILSGLFVGYYWVILTEKLRELNVFLRIIIGTVYGSIAGVLSGASVHIPGLFMEKNVQAFTGGLDGIYFGASFGLMIGTFLGFFGACLLSLLFKKGRSE